MSPTWALSISDWAARKRAAAAASRARVSIAVGVGVLLISSLSQGFFSASLFLVGFFLLLIWQIGGFFRRQFFLGDDECRANLVEQTETEAIEEGKGDHQPDPLLLEESHEGRAEGLGRIGDALRRILRLGTLRQDPRVVQGQHAD